MKVLVGCEQSGVVRRAFTALGHDAWSCDLLPAEDGSSNHFQGDVLEVLGNGWDLAIFHPPCDYLTVSGNKWFRDDAVAGPGILTGAARREAQRQAVEFVKTLWDAPVARIALENPIGRLSTLWMKPTQTVQPFHFGDPYRKATCLWLKNLPKLERTSNLKNGQPACWQMPPGKNRKKLRGVTYPGVAAAMAQQWGNCL